MSLMDETEGLAVGVDGGDESGCFPGGIGDAVVVPDALTWTFGRSRLMTRLEVVL